MNFQEQTSAAASESGTSLYRNFKYRIPNLESVKVLCHLQTILLLFELCSTRSRLANKNQFLSIRLVYDYDDLSAPPPSYLPIMAVTGPSQRWTSFVSEPPNVQHIQPRGEMESLFWKAIHSVISVTYPSRQCLADHSCNALTFIMRYYRFVIAHGETVTFTRAPPNSFRMKQHSEDPV